MFTIERNKRINEIIIFYHRSGLWRNESGTVFQKFGSRLFYLFFGSFFVVSTFYGAILSSEWSDQIFLTSLALAGAVHFVKVIYLLWKKEEILAFIQEMCSHSIKDHDKFIEIEKKLKQFTDFVHIFTSVLFSGYVCVFILSLPVFSNEKRLVVSIWFPLDWKNSDVAYWMANVTLYILCLVTLVSALLSIIVWYLMLNCSIKYDTLADQFRNIFEIRPKEVDGSVSGMSVAFEKHSFLEEFLSLINNHQNLQWAIHRMKSLFSVLFFSQITTSGLSICCIIYGLIFSESENLFLSAMYIVGILYCIFDIFMIMYFGNEIKSSSDQLSYCLFESEWIDQSEPLKKYIIILTELLRQPQELVIGKLYPLNLKTFTTIMNFAYRAFNILQNLR